MIHAAIHRVSENTEGILTIRLGSKIKGYIFKPGWTRATFEMHQKALDKQESNKLETS